MVHTQRSMHIYSPEQAQLATLDVSYRILYFKLHSPKTVKQYYLHSYDVCSRVPVGDSLKLNM